MGLYILFSTFSTFFYLKSCLDYECTPISANHMIYNVGYLEQTGKKCSHLDEKHFFLHFFFLKEMQENGIS